MPDLSLTDIFNTTPRCKKQKSERYTDIRIRTTFLSSTSLSTELRADRLEKRKLNDSPYRILDAPGIIDDFYINVLDWHDTNIYIGLGSSVYSYNTDTRRVSEIITLKEGYVSCIKANKTLAIGTSEGSVYLMNDDIEIGRYKCDTSRVSALDWNGSVLSAGSKNGKIVHYDTLNKRITSEIAAHDGEICGMKWSIDYKYLATGSNDNTVKIWRMGFPTPKNTIHAHTSAVKALAWCPWRNGILATGGGTKDKTIKIWDVKDNKLEMTRHVDSQVSGLHYGLKYRELISTHGFSDNNIVVWKACNLKRIGELGKHEGRVLCSAVNQKTSHLVSVGVDENLKFWEVYNENEEVVKRSSMVFR